MLNPHQFGENPDLEGWDGKVIPADEFHAPVRDLTSARVSFKTNQTRDRADVYRSARHAYNLHMEAEAKGYKTESKLYREHNPPPTWKGFLKEGFA